MAVHQPDLAVLLCQVLHHHVKQWLHHDRNQHMSGRAYRQHALAEMSNSATFDYRSATHAWSLCPSLLACCMHMEYYIHTQIC